MRSPDPEIVVRLSGALAAAAGGQRAVSLRAATVGQALSALEDRYPALRPRLRGPDGRLRPHILLFLDSAEIRARGGEETPVSPGDELLVLAVLEGG